ncbi:MAG: VOC family protein [Stellaceae bacterium]
MPGQVPEPGALFLDHVAHFVPAIEPAAAALERCGFRLTPFTAQTNRVDGKPVAAGTANRCAMLRCGYVEILAATADPPLGDTPLARQLREGLARHVGLHLAAFSSADAADERRRLAAAGFPVQPLVDMRRPAATQNGAAEARFSIARIGPDAMPEGRIQFLTHHTPSLVWPEAYLDHPNGARALAALWVAAADPDEAARRFARFTGRPVRGDRDSTAITLDRGVLRFAAPTFLRRQFGIVPGPPLPYLAAYEIEIESLDVLRPVLASAELAARALALADGVAVMLPPAIGGTIVFRVAAGA